MSMRLWLALLGFLFLAIPSDRIRATEEIWLRFFDPPAFSTPRLDPHGCRLAWLAPAEGVRNVWWRELDKDSGEICLTLDRGAGVAEFFWSGDGESLYVLRDRFVRGDWRLYRVGVRDGLERPVAGELDLVRLLYRNPTRPDEVVVALPDPAEFRFNLHRLDLRDNKLQFLLTGEVRVGNWHFDGELRPRLRSIPRPDGSVFYEWRPDPRRNLWTPALDFHGRDALHSGVLTLDADGRRAWLVDSTDAPATRLVLVELETRDRRTLAERAGRDLVWSWSRLGQDGIAIVAFAGETEDVEILDPAVAGDWERLRGHVTGRLRIVDADQAGRFWIVERQEPGEWPEYWLLPLGSGEIRLLGRQRESLPPALAGQARTIRYPALDGTLLAARLTLPASGAESPLPLVVLVMQPGGLPARSGPDPDRAWFVSRGWACLEPETRGSPGRGKDFLLAADRHWADRVAQDLVDAATWACNEGIADPWRLVIFGRGTGGLQALLAQLAGGDSFRAAIAVSFPPDPEEWIRSLPPGMTEMRARLVRQFGEPGRDVLALASASLTRRAAEFRHPLFLVHGDRDPWIPLSSVQVFANSLPAGTSTVLHAVPAEGGPWFSPAAEAEWHRRLAVFLSDLASSPLPDSGQDIKDHTMKTDDNR